MTDSPKIAPQAFTIREAIMIDAASIANFNIAMALETESHRLDEFTVNSGVAAVIDDHSLGFYLVAEVDNKVVGCLLVTNEWSDWRNGMYWWIQSVYVCEENRGKGIYRGLYNEVLNRARQAGYVSAVRLYVEQDNLVAQSVYRKLGMQNSGYQVFETSFN
jgi:ribosomal protein S18 acetylase RimI-like enzyme